MALLASALSRNAALNAIGALLNSGKLRIYSGTPPVTADTVLAGNTLLAELAFGATAFGAAAAASMAANAITQDTTADAAGTGTFWRGYASDGTTCHLQGTCGTSGTDLIMNTNLIALNGIVQVTALTVSM